MNNLRYFACAVALLGAGAVAGCSSSSDSSGPDATLKVKNNSDFQIVELHVTSVGNSSWGPNLLSSAGLDPGSSITLGVNCDTYDALLVDEAGVDCQLHSIDLCLNDADWIIQNDTCTAFSQGAPKQTQARDPHPATK